jgi:hypothetical protein
VLTGQAEAYEDNTYKKIFSNIYRKGIDRDIEQLFVDIKKAADNQEDTQLRHKHRRVFEACTEEYIGYKTSNDLLQLLKLNDDSDLENNLNTVRKIIEDLFISFNRNGLLPDVFVKPSVSLNPSSIFLSGSKNNRDDAWAQFIHNEETHLPAPISSTLRYILAIVQSGSHRSEVDRHLQEVKAPYLFKSILFQLLHIITWYKMYIDRRPKKENWKTIQANTETTKPQGKSIEQRRIITKKKRTF